MNRPVWVDDNAVNDCSSCHQEFSFLRRKHHCRNCGKIFCRTCTTRTISIPKYQHFAPVRVCDVCYQVLSQSTALRGDMQPANVVKQSGNRKSTRGVVHVTSEFHKAEDSDGLEPLDEVVRNGNLRRLRRRLITSPTPDEDVIQTFTKERTLLHFAAEAGHIDIVKVLVDDYKVPLDCHDANGDTPLHFAVQNHHKDVVEHLLSKGLSPNLTNQSGDTPLHTAATSQLSGDDIISLLLANGANPSAVNNNNRTCLVALCANHVAAYFPRALQKMIEKAKDKRALVNQPDKDGLTGLHLVAWDGVVPLVVELLKAGVDVNATDKLGDTPLHKAMSPTEIALVNNLKGLKETIQELLNAGAKLNVKNQAGLIPLQVCRHVELRSVLPASTQSKELEQPVSEPANIILHDITASDSLIGLALYYSVEVEEILRVNNNLTHKNLFAFKQIKIPAAVNGQNKKAKTKS